METSNTSILWPIIAGAVIILANAFFVLFEFAIVTVRRGQIERLATEGNGNAKLVSHMLRDPDMAIAGSQVGITMASVLLGIVAEEPLRVLLSPLLARLFGQVPLLAPLSTALATVLVFLLLSFILMVIGEQTPKTVALRYPGAKRPGRCAPHDDLRKYHQAAGLASGSIHGAGAETAGSRRSDRRSRHPFA